ncbi:MAG TPA: cation:proton antiporter [Verrucomicrobiae bacterium]|jgi:hypothetical protein
MILIILVARWCGSLALEVRQPAVVEEMIAGILLGPSLLGWVCPGVFRVVFLPASLGPLRLLSQIGVCLFMFVAGMELDVSELKQQARRAVVISQTSILFPYVLGVGASLFLYTTMAGPKTAFPAFAIICAPDLWPPIPPDFSDFYPVQAGAGAGAGAFGLQFGGAVALQAGPFDGARNGAGHGVDEVAQARRFRRRGEIAAQLGVGFVGEGEGLAVRGGLAEQAASLDVAGFAVGGRAADVGKGGVFHGGSLNGSTGVHSASVQGLQGVAGVMQSLTSPSQGPTKNS